MATKELLLPKKFSLGRRRTRQELRLGLTPTAVYMLQYWIRPILRNAANGWAELNIAAFARRPGAPCLRACREAYNRLYRVQEQLGISLCHNHDEVPKIYVCATVWLDAAPDSDRLPLFFKNGNERRHIRLRHETEDLPLSLNAALYIAQPRFHITTKPHDADPALTLSSSVKPKQTEDPFQSKPSLKTGFALKKIDQKLVGWIRNRCKEALPASYGFVWSPKAQQMVSGYVRKALKAAHDKQDILDCFTDAAETLVRSQSFKGTAGLVAIKASELIKSYTSRGSTPQARLASFALRKKTEKVSPAQADADQILRHLADYAKTNLVDFTLLSFLTLAVFKDRPAKVYLFGKTTRLERKFLYSIHCRIQRDLFYQSRPRQRLLNLVAA
jgi:hypothetical protein